MLIMHGTRGTPGAGRTLWLRMIGSMACSAIVMVALTAQQPERPRAFIDGSEPGALPELGIEIQMLDHGFAEQYEKRTGKKGDWFTTNGDVFAVGKTVLKPFPPTSPNGSRSFPRRNLSKGVGEWNHYYVRAVNGQIRLWVNGEEVSGGSGAQPRSGYLCMEAEGSPVEFRNIRVRELP